MSSKWELDDGITSIKSAWQREHTARANLEKMLQKAEADNARLRGELSDVPKCETCEAMFDCDECLRADASQKERKRLYYENAKLRELVRDMWRFTGEACKKYPRLFDPAAQGGQMVQLNMIDAFEQRMRELGIEVGA